MVDIELNFRECELYNFKLILKLSSETVKILRHNIPLVNWEPRVICFRRHVFWDPDLNLGRYSTLDTQITNMPATGSDH